MFFGERAHASDQCCRLRRSERLAIQFNSSMPTNNTPAATNRSRFVIFILQVTEQHQGKTRRDKAGADPQTASFSAALSSPAVARMIPTRRLSSRTLSKSIFTQAV